MPDFALIGYGAMAGYVAKTMQGTEWRLRECLVRAGREDAARNRLGCGVKLVHEVADLSDGMALVAD